MSLKKILYFIVIIGFIFTINNLGHSIYDLWHKKDLVIKARQEVEKEKKENEELKTKLSVVNKPDFIEQEARNRLLLVKPGEDVIVIPTGYLHKSTIVASSVKDTRPNWKKWWELFF